MVTRSRTLLAALVVVAAMVALAPAASGVEPRPVLQPDDWSAPVVDSPQVADAMQGLFDEDPTGLVPKTLFVQRYSLDQDHWEVWLCGSVSSTLPQAIAALEAATVDYFDAQSGGRYGPVFTAGGTKPSDANCLPEFLNGTYTTVGSPEGILIVDSITGGGYASPGIVCISSDPDCGWIPATFPGNTRYAVVGENSVLNYPSVTAHELGHTLQWPHSNSGTGDEYDNPMDLMSGNLTTGGWTEADPYGTLSYNRFQSGWVSESDVVVADGSYQAVTLQPVTAAGTQLFAIKTALPGRFYVFGARTTSTYDPIPSAWQGVAVYEVDYYCSDPVFSGGICPGVYRDQTQEPPSPDGVGHVLQPGESIELEGITVTVTGTTATGYTLTADPNPGVDSEPSAPGTPAANPGDKRATLTWTAAADGGSAILGYRVEVENRDLGGSTITDVGVTLATTASGLNNGDSYRARVRATNAIGDGPWSSWSADFTPGTSSSGTFVDDDGSVFEADIEWLAAEGITQGCNPPLNDRFCPDDPVTRGQMAAFLVRALGLSAQLGDPFVDDDGSIFEGDIEKLAAAGITRGCNPPLNNRYCPDDAVTREQMAAFLVRALGYTDPGAGDLFVDDNGSIFEADIDRLAAAGVTRGCNPPVNDRFCPTNVVTRGQMAAFLHRVLG